MRMSAPRVAGWRNLYRYKKYRQHIMRRRRHARNAFICRRHCRVPREYLWRVGGAPGGSETIKCGAKNSVDKLA